MKSRYLVAILLIALLACIPGTAAGVAKVQAAGNSIERVSVSENGTEANEDCYLPRIGSDGRYVVFGSSANNLVENDRNSASDVFIRDRQIDITSLVSISSSGTQGNHGSWDPTISHNGRYIAFVSFSNNLVPDDTNNLWDIFVRDIQDNTTTIVSISDNGTQANDLSQYPGISGDGRYVAFESYATNLVPLDTNHVCDIFVRDLMKDTITRASTSASFAEGNGTSRKPWMSYDGLDVAFSSQATNLVSDDTNSMDDIFVRDFYSDNITRVSISGDGVQSNNQSFDPCISYNGRFISFASYASNLVPGDTNSHVDIFVYDRLNDTTTRVSLASDGAQGNADSSYPSISGDGRYVAFVSDSNNLVPKDANNQSDIFVHDCQTSETAIVSIKSDGIQGNDRSWFPNISGDGSCISFASLASNLVPDDTNGKQDVFVADNPLYQQLPTSASVASTTGTGTIAISTSEGGIQYFNAVSQDDLECGDLPTSSSFSHGFLSFGIGDIAPGSTVTVTITFPSPLPEGVEYWECCNGNWLEYTPLIGHDNGDEILTLTLTDGGTGDCDGLVNGEISDPGGPAILAAIHASTSTPRKVSPAMPNWQLNTAQMSLQYLSVNPSQAQANQPLTITGNVVNSGDFAGNYNLALKINGTVEETRMVSVGPRASQPVKFTVARSQPGTYNVDLGGQLTSFTVLDSSHVNVAHSNSRVLVILLLGLLLMAFVILLLWRRRTT